MEASLQRATTCFWVTMWTGGSSPWRLSVSSWPTKSNIQRTSSCWGEITSVHPSIEYMASMMSVSTLLSSYFSFKIMWCYRYWINSLHPLFQVKEGTTSNSGKHSQIVLTASPLLPLLMRRSSAAMEVGYWVLRWIHTVVSLTSVSTCLLILLPLFLAGLSPDLQSMEQIRRIMRPTDVPDQGLLCDLLWSDPDKDVLGWGENDRGVSFTFGSEVVAKFLHKHDLDLICRAHQVFTLSFVGCGDVLHCRVSHLCGFFSSFITSATV